MTSAGRLAAQVLWLLIGSCVFASRANPASLDPDPFELVASGSQVDELIQASLFGAVGADAALSRWLQANPEAGPEQRVAVFHRQCNENLLRGWYALAVAACTEKSGLTGKPSPVGRLASALTTLPPIRTRGSTTTALSNNPLGSKSVDVRVNDVTLPWFVDTGAEISVLSATSAAQLDVRYLPEDVDVTTTTAPIVGRLAVIDLLRIGNATVENVPVLVLEDAGLTAGTFRIPAILGLPVMVAFRRMAWMGGGTQLQLGEAVTTPPAGAPKLYWHEDGVGLPMQIGGVTRGAFFDTGANSSYLWTSKRALLREHERALLTRRSVQIAGAGGTVQRDVEELPAWHTAVGGVGITLHCVTLDEGESASIGVIGSDVLDRLGRLTLDFENMTVEARALASQTEADRSCFPPTP